MKMEEEIKFLNILEPRKAECGIFRFMTRAWHPHRTFDTDKYYSPQDLKEVAAKSIYLDSFIEVESSKSGVSKQKLKKEVLDYLEEIGLEKKMHVIRWMGIGFLKIAFMMKVGIFVNEPAVLRLKSSMGKNPILFLPTHRSYADFCVLTYLCYHYDIELPAVAAGMDFYSMAVVGQRMRETGAFYIRRTLTGAPLYAATLKQYVRTVVAKYSSPVEFFLEGTRSRSNKSLSPKYGVLSMSLMPLFAREVSDVTIVPVNISYDRLMEHGLFAYEHLGVPKPKESTGGLLKSLYKLNDHYGNIYINFGAPLSVRSYLGEVSHSDVLKPVDLQQITPDQFKQVQAVAEYVISLQQKATVVTISNLLALVLMDSIVKSELLDLDQVLSEVSWMVQVLTALGALVYENDVKSSVERILVVHREFMRLDKENRLRLVTGTLMDVSSEVQKKMKGHTLRAETMATALPIIQLQLYVNPVLHYLLPPALIYLLVHEGAMAEDELASQYHRVRKLLRHEFYYVDENEANTFESALSYCVSNDVVFRRAGQLAAGGAQRLQRVLRAAAWPAVAAADVCARVAAQERKCTHSRLLKLIQAAVESSHCHPYCLSLDCAGNCLGGLVLAGALLRDKLENEMSYVVVPDAMAQARELIGAILPKLRVDFTTRNPVVMARADVAAKL
ncbi:dihydroxyacetone phosphate acyltransferase [Plodia interpunctella]|uniref:dihydroxyacetone phosphate acyltransferase n=1 Tax=Plodia interpunctella TaxID=58824 RepID=UPI0023679CB1|nr:dihydroxyacetone phosphate acyltransferase [Plodia interpunctella]